MRQREQGGVFSRIGDIFLEAAANFRLVYVTYIGHLSMAEKAVNDEVNVNYRFNHFLEVSPTPTALPAICTGRI